MIELQLPGGLIDLAHEWLGRHEGALDRRAQQWRFPGPATAGAGGATLTFGYLANRNDVRRYLGTSYSLHRLRRADPLRRDQLPAHVPRPAPADRQRSHRLGAAPDGTRLADVPPRSAPTSNPGGPGHSWVKNRFVDPQAAHPASSTSPPASPTTPTSTTTTYLDTLAKLPPPNANG